jgi:DnaJ-class molecular chaperone
MQYQLPKNNELKVNDTKIIPKVLPFRCPVCKGFGTVNYGRQTCKACEGKGYILVDQEEENTYDINTGEYKK